MSSKLLKVHTMCGDGGRQMIHMGMSRSRRSTSGRRRHPRNGGKSERPGDKLILEMISETD